MAFMAGRRSGAVGIERRRTRRCLLPGVCLRWAASLVGTRRPAAGSPTRRLSAAAFASRTAAERFQNGGSHTAHPSPTLGNAAFSRAHTETLATLEPRRRVRLPEETAKR